MHIRDIGRTLRPHQWVKNLLLVVPPFAAHRFEPGIAVAVGLAFISLSLCASGGYVLNDLLDLTADRHHHRKRNRPFASGQLPVSAGIVLIALCWALGLGIAAALLPFSFFALVAAYVVCTSVYSTWLKRQPVLDVMFLAGLYVLRVVAGGAATDVPVSTWLLAFTLFICLSLAFMKRFIEVDAERRAGLQTSMSRRGYLPEDAQWLQTSGLTSGYLAVVILALYVNNPEVTGLYTHPERLLLACPVLLYGITRSWLLAHRNQVHDDPVVAVAADPVTFILIAIAGIVVYSAI